MDKLLHLAHQESIIVEEFFLEEPLKGIYIHQDNRPPIIGLSTTIDTLYEKRSILAEELGHHFTSVGNALPCQFYNYHTRMNISKIEYKAMRWAASYLIPDDDLIEVLRNGLYQPCELAEHFCVVPELINIRLKLFEKAIYF